MNDKQSITDKVLERIEKTTPRSRIYFLIRNTGMWLLAGLSIIMGALAISSIIFRAVNAGVALRPGTPPVFEVLLVVPFIWIALLVVFGYLAYREVRSTRKGYKYEFSTLILGMVLASCVLGIVFYTTGAGFALDRAAARLLPFHADLERVQRDRWQSPEDGFIIGTVLTRTDSEIILTDPAHTRWNISFAEGISTTSVEALVEGQKVGVRGKLVNADEHTFLACSVRSLEFEGRGPAHRPGAMIDERNNPPPRSSECEDVRPRN